MDTEQHRGQSEASSGEGGRRPVNGHDPDPGYWHPEDLAAAWLYASTDASDREGADSAAGDDVPPEGDTGTRHDGPAIQPVESIEAPAVQAPLVGRIAPYPGALTLLYGEPAAGKSYAALGWAQRVIAGGGRVLVMDYEHDAMAWKHRARDIGLPEGLWYMDPMGVPITERRTFDASTVEGFDLVVVDSVLMALGAMGENEWSPSNVLDFRHAVESWPCPVLGLAHQGPRSSGGGVFGSKYWTALAGVIWHMTNEANEGRRITLVKNRYGAEGEGHLVHLHHNGDGPVYAISETPISHDEG